MSLEFTKDLEERMDRIMAEGLEDSLEENETNTEEETETRKRYDESGIDERIIRAVSEKGFV